MSGSSLRSYVVTASFGLVAFAACGNSQPNDAMQGSGAGGTPSLAGASNGGSHPASAGAAGTLQHAGRGGQSGGDTGVYAGAGGASDAAGAGGEAGASNSDEYGGCRYAGSETGFYLRILDTLAGPLSDTHVLGVSADGSTVVGSSTPEDGWPHAVIWRPDGSLEDLFTASNGLLVQAHFASCDGKVTLVHARGARYRHEANGDVQVPGCGTDLPALEVEGMDESGNVLVGECQATNSQDSYARRWYGSQSPLPIDAFKGYGLAVSGDGLVFAGQREDGSSRRVFRWTEAHGTETLFASPFGKVRMSADGSTIVAQGVDGGYVRWRNGVETPVPCDTQKTYCYPTLVSGNGRTLVMSIDSELMVWQDDEPLRSLRDLLAEAGVDLSAWGSFIVNAWTPDKRVLVGSLQKTSVADQVPFYLVLPKGTL
ncbi:MAG TPA: hypothetical protein VJV79_38145 [Polyangiaceae bacterium]|nr:hypothetical protein [Polyangiaceae bacterium]